MLNINSLATFKSKFRANFKQRKRNSRDVEGLCGVGVASAAERVGTEEVTLVHVSSGVVEVVADGATSLMHYGPAFFVYVIGHRKDFWITESGASGREEAEKFSASDSGPAGVGCWKFAHGPPDVCRTDHHLMG